MDELLKKAKEFLEANWNLNEVELSDGINKVRVVRISYPHAYDAYPYTYNPIYHTMIL